MFSVIVLTRACFLSTAGVIVLLAFTVAGCSSDVSRLGDNLFPRALKTDRPPFDVSPAVLSGSDASTFRTQPDVANSTRWSAKVFNPAHSATRVIAHRKPNRKPVWRNPTLAFAKRNDKAISKEAALNRGGLTVNDPRSRAQPQQAPGTGLDKVPATDAKPTFQWPVHGKLLAHFGSLPNGEKNYGIAIAVPEDTPIKSAEDGVVIYAGNALKGFGNLVLMRHTGNYVTVYAHAKTLEVQRGDHVRRGDIIGKSGQTGYVTTPQLYFEVRKGATPVDPLGFLQERA